MEIRIIGIPSEIFANGILETRVLNTKGLFSVVVIMCWTLPEALTLEVAAFVPALMLIEIPMFISFCLFVNVSHFLSRALDYFLDLKSWLSLVGFLEHQIENKKQ